jgi:gliding motility-associated lipoprotein GldD
LKTKILNFSLYKIVILLLTICLFWSCSDDVLPKQKGFLRLEYSSSEYKKINIKPFEFEASKVTDIRVNEKSWVKIKYPKQKAVINLTYRPIKNNLRELLLEAEKLTIKHSIMADKIGYFPPFENPEEQVYGKLSKVTGNAASPVQFYITDSVRHFITGSLYFKVQPNYDSVYPAIKYIEKDIIHLIETVKWK